MIFLTFLKVFALLRFSLQLRLSAPCWAILASSWGLPGRSWGDLGACVGHLGGLFGHLGALLAGLGAHLGHLGATWGGDFAREVFQKREDDDANSMLL